MSDANGFPKGKLQAKEMASTSNERDENYLRHTASNDERCYVNDAFQATEETALSRLNNVIVKQNSGQASGIEKHLDDVITNNLCKDSCNFVENKKENINLAEKVEENISTGNSKQGKTKQCSTDNPGRDTDVFDTVKTDLYCENLNNGNIITVKNINLKRSLSFGDKPTKRKRKEEKSVKTLDEATYDRPLFYNETEQSSSTDSAFSGDSWRLPIDEFTSKRQGSKRKHRKVSKQMRSFYKSQDDLITQYEEIRLDLDDATENAEMERQLREKASLYAKATFAINFVLLIIKVVAVVLSGSVSLISSLVDSSVDLLSGIVIWVTARAVKKTDRYSYPQGRTKLEPVSIVILAVIMSVASLQIIKESFAKIFGLIDNSQSPPNMDWATIGIASATVVIKFILYIFCRRVKHPTVQALALDHRNDVLSNFIAIVFGYLGSREMQTQVDSPDLVYIDPIGAIIISIYIIANWVITGWDQIKLLIGHTATSAFISKITWICVDHHKKIEKVETVRAFHFGYSFLVEVDIVLPPEMTLRESHDIAEPLQQKLEKLPNVERAFVHVDYEATHDPKSEHKVV
ncbi:uncharacterized protein LOC123539362 isoform X2 [Mercenaria mercenaria]|uniref:uncharacterized protein LOC123539362 isoform X2 n=1 Tax=Mercenaria mercenaria TaxID=6596 RepID=UPI00234EE678|nr:uncharacterized protein LOC123539362 isoform X2 [Mercenaria mercenaria]